MTSTSNAAILPEGPERQRAVEAVQDLLTQTVDARAGYDSMLDKAEREFRPVVQKFRATHAQHAERLAAIVTALGGTPDTDGGMMSTVNKAVVSLRALFDEIDEDVMDGVRDGERRVLNHFDEAIDAVGQSYHRDELVGMRQEISALLDETRHLD